MYNRKPNPRDHLQFLWGFYFSLREQRFFHFYRKRQSVRHPGTNEAKIAWPSHHGLIARSLPTHLDWRDKALLLHPGPRGRQFGFHLETNWATCHGHPMSVSGSVWIPFRWALKKYPPVRKKGRAPLWGLNPSFQYEDGQTPVRGAWQSHHWEPSPKSSWPFPCPGETGARPR